MAFGDSSRIKVSSMPELTRGTIPSTALQIARITGIRNKATKQTVTSGELREDRQVSDITEVGAGATLALDFELSYGTFDEWLAGLFFNAWSSPVTVTGSSDINFDLSDAKITKSGASFDTQFKVGEVIRVRGTTNNGTNSVPKYFTITALSATEITVAEALVDETGTSAQLYGCRLRNWNADVAGGGFVDKSYTFEFQQTNLSNIFANSRGLTIGGMNLKLASRAIVTGDVDLLGFQLATASSTIGTGSATAATTTRVFNATANVATLLEGGSAIANVKSLDLAITNNLREQAALASKYNVGIGGGQFVITGSLDPYFVSNALLDKFINHTETALRFDLLDAAGNRIIVSLPSVYYAGGDAGPEASGNNQDTMLTLPFAARRHDTLGFTIQICRFPAP